MKTLKIWINNNVINNNNDDDTTCDKLKLLIFLIIKY